GSPVGPYITADAARMAGAVTLNYGLFVNSVFSFLTISWVAFWFLKFINRLKRKTEDLGQTKDNSTKVCEYCLTVIPIKAKKCSACASEVAQIEVN
ncbi:MAG: large conductance mechanosensitive channel protein MscL, partial [Deltaproteobacteria bacterium]